MTTTAPLSAASAAALRDVVENRGATLNPATARALAARGLVRSPYWNQPHYVRPTAAGDALVRGR